MDPFVTYKNFSSVQEEDMPVAPDVNFALKQGYVNSYLLVASTHKEITVPAGARFAVFAADNDVWVRVGGTAAIPAGDTTNGTGSELNPSVRYLGGAAAIGIISGAAAKVSIMFYS